ncbi:MAG: FAD-dependent monooxygenase, partial [Pseudomonadota bacterium]
MTDAPVIIAGGGPVGLTLALELDHHGVDCILLERNPTTTRHPKMDITNGRSMELFRRLGVVDLLRAKAVPPDNPYSVIWCDRLSGWELASFDYPSVNEKRANLRKENDGKSALEPGMRVSQILLEPVLKKKLEDDCKHVSVMFGWALEGFDQDADGVTVQIKSSETGEQKTLRCEYLAGCDGAGSVARKGLGIPLHTISQPGAHTIDSDETIDLDPANPGPDRRLYMIHFKSPEIDRINQFGPAWHLQSPLGWSLIAQDDVDTWTIHVPVPPEADPSTWDPKKVLFDALGCEIECDIHVANPWTPRLCLADSYGEGRVWLAGDSTHQVIPTGGYGMNTGIGDATALGWVLSAIVNDWGGQDLLKAYEIERRHVGERNRHASFRHANLRMRIRASYNEQIHACGAAGDEARRHYGQLIQDLGNLE